MNGQPAAAGVQCAGRHALGWLVASNAVGVMLAIWLAWPALGGSIGEIGYGRWVPVHLDGQLYGWTALPLVGWLFAIYQVESGGRTAVGAWSVALALGVLWSLAGLSSGKLFLDWAGGSLAAWLAAAVVLWLVLARGWWRAGPAAWSLAGRGWRGIGLGLLATVPLSMAWAASPKVYPPIDPTTGGPTGASLLGSTLLVVALLLLLPRVPVLERRRSGGRWLWCLWGVEILVCGVLEARGGSHFSAAQVFALALLLPWLVLVPLDWARFEWPAAGGGWRVSVFGWWGLLVASGFLVFLPGVLDRSKFTQVLVAHSHLAMAGFTSSFVILLLVRLGAWSGGGAWLRRAWNLALGGQLAVLAWMGWREGGGAEWMIEPAAWRHVGMGLRLVFGLVMLAVSVGWWIGWSRENPERRIEA